MTTTSFKILHKHVPETSLSTLHKWFDQRPFHLKITKHRNTKFGDFRAPVKKHELATISVNGNLNPYAFLITLTHEFAHLMIWNRHKGKVKAHGMEWKNEFAKLLTVLVTKGVFPTEIETALKQHLKNPAASSARDPKLVIALRNYDPPSSSVHLSELKIGAHFVLNDKRIFIKGEKKRTRYLCTELSSKKTYLIHGIAEVKEISTQ